MDHLLSGNLAACGDALLQRFKAVELAGKAGWAVASRISGMPPEAKGKGVAAKALAKAAFAGKAKAQRSKLRPRHQLPNHLQK